MESVEMESSATVEFSGSNPQIVKRKRTGRRRTTLSSSLSEGDLKRCVSSEDRNYESTVTTEEEEEDMANCLIMLARGGSGGRDGVFLEDSGKAERKRKSSVEISAVSGGGYECKTCDKAFMSFQALGGHRASHHKKAKIEDVKLTSTVDQVQMLASSTARLVNAKASSSSSSLSVVAHSTKVHECAICGSAFSSGQALGGHMRRHRTAVISGMSPAVELPHKEADAVVEIAMNNSSNNSFLSSLDLNLPAPDEEDDAVEDHNRRFHHQFSIGLDNKNNNNNSSATPSAALAFSAPPLVGCYF